MAEVGTELENMPLVGSYNVNGNDLSVTYENAEGTDSLVYDAAAGTLSLLDNEFAEGDVLFNRVG